MLQASRQCRRRHRARGLSPVRPLSTAPLWTASSRVARSCGPNQSVDGHAWRSGCARAEHHEQRQSGPLDVPRFLRQERPRGGAVLAAGAAQRPDLDVHHRRHGAVQERLHRPGDALLHARHHGAEVRARRRQAQRSRQRRLHQPAPHVLRDARQLLLRRLLQGAGDPAGVGAGHQGLRARPQAPARHHLPRRRGRLPHLEEGGGLLRRQDHPHRHLRQLLVGGRDGPVRAVLGDLPRPGRQGRGRPAGQRRPGWRPLPGVLEPRLHAVRAARARRPRRPAQALDRHRHGPRAHDGHPAGRAVRLRHRSVSRADRGLRGGNRRGGQGRAPGLPPRDRRPPARHELPDRRGRAALQRRPRLRAAPHHAPRHAACASAGRQGAADVAAGAGAGAADGRDLPRAGARAAADHRDAEAGGDALPQDAGEGPGPARRGERHPQEGRRVLPATSPSSSTTPSASRST